MNLPPFPEPYSYPRGDYFFNEEQMQAYGQECYEKALLDAMNATLPFGKVGRVIAAAIRSLKS